MIERENDHRNTGIRIAADEYIYKAYRIGNEKYNIHKFLKVISMSSISIFGTKRKFDSNLYHYL